MSNWNSGSANLNPVRLSDLNDNDNSYNSTVNDDLIFGCGPLGRNYTSSSIYESKEPVEAVKYALDNG